MLTFKVKGQVYHKAGSLLLFLDVQYKFLQKYLIIEGNDELNAHWKLRYDGYTDAGQLKMAVN